MGIYFGKSAPETSKGGVFAGGLMLWYNTRSKELCT